MSEEKFKVGDRVILNERGKNIFRELSDSDMPMRISAEEYDVYKCWLKGDDSFLYLRGYLLEPYVKKAKQEYTSSKEVVFEELTKQMLETFKKKNADYGDSTTQTFKEFGLTSYAIRLNDKLNRVKSFCKKGELEVKDERIIDTLMDMSAYCLLAVIDIKNKEKWERQ